MLQSTAAAFVFDAGSMAANGGGLIEGAIAGAFVATGAFLAGYAAIRRSGLALCAMLVVLAAGVLEMSWLGFLPALQRNVGVFILAVFAALAIVFVSAAITSVRYNGMLGALLLAGALVIAGMGLINFLDRIEISSLMRMAILAAGGAMIATTLYFAIRGDTGARLVLPGAALVLAAPILGPLGVSEGAAFSFAPHALFTIGVLTASVVALTEGAAPKNRTVAISGHNAQFNGVVAGSGPHKNEDKRLSEREDLVLDSQLGRVLDYTGVGIWDWSPEGVKQSDCLPSLFGAQSQAPLTPEAIANFIHRDDAARFQNEVMTAKDGPFDVVLKSAHGSMLRFRGARAAYEDRGELERLVAFIEPASLATQQAQPASLFKSPVDGDKVRSATEAAIVPGGSALAGRFLEALNKGEIVAAFQPIVTLRNKSIAGYEALARWRGNDDISAERPETFVRAAESAGYGPELAKTMLEQAASFLSEKQASEKRKDLFAAINLSWRQMADEGFAAELKQVMSDYKLPKGAIVLELTEGDAINDHRKAPAIFASLKKAGAALAFDDFGAGFSCLSNLRQYDFDYLKIDKSFADDLKDGGDGAKIVRSLTELGKSLGLKVIVEGIETRGAAKAAREMGCAFAQGFAFGEPEESPMRLDPGAHESSGGNLESASEPQDHKGMPNGENAGVMNEGSSTGRSQSWLWRRGAAH